MHFLRAVNDCNSSVKKHSRPKCCLCLCLFKEQGILWEDCTVLMCSLVKHMKFCAWLLGSFSASTPIFLWYCIFKLKLEMLSILWEGGGIIFPVNGCRKLEKHLSPGLRNMFVLCERERCHLSVCEMTAAYLLLLGCCLLGYCTGFWMRALR